MGLILALTAGHLVVAGKADSGCGLPLLPGWLSWLVRGVCLHTRWL